MGSDIKPSGQPSESEQSLPAYARETISLANAGDGSGQVNSSSEMARHSRTELTGTLGRYRIVKRLGEGGMGTVYLAYDAQFDSHVALKVPHFAAGNDEQVIQRFYREARSTIKLRHSNICPVYDVGEIGGQHFISMAYIEGRPLSTFVNAERPLPERQVARVVCKIALALQEAHQNGIVHRDLKPSNIMYDEKRKEPIVMDFGLAGQLQSSTEPRLTQSGTLLGSPSYMSPEQVGAERHEIGPASDIYSLGVILYELLTGRLPFEGSVAIVLGRIALQAPEPPSRFRQHLDPRLEEICLKAMAKKVDDRFASMREFAKALADFANSPTNSGDGSLKGESLSPHVARATAEPDREKPASRPVTSIPGAKPKRRAGTSGKSVTAGSKLSVWLPWGLVGALCIVGGICFQFGMSKGPPPGSAASPPGAAVSAGDDVSNRPRLPSHGSEAAPEQSDPRDWPLFGHPPDGPPAGPHGNRPPHEITFEEADRDGNNLLAPDEYALHIIHRADQDGDDRLTRDELESARQKLGEELFRPPSPEERRALEGVGPVPGGPGVQGGPGRGRGGPTGPPGKRKEPPPSE